MTTLLQLAEIPDDLAAEAAKVPGLPERLIGFLRAEVSQHSREQRPFRVQAKDLVRQAQEDAVGLNSTGVTPEQARAEFFDLYLEVMDEVSKKT